MSDAPVIVVKVTCVKCGHQVRMLPDDYATRCTAGAPLKRDQKRQRQAGARLRCKRCGARWPEIDLVVK